MSRRLITRLMMLVVFLLLAEGLAWFILWASSEPAEGFLVSPGDGFHQRMAREFVGTSRGPLAVDPHLGYAPEHAFQVYGAEEGKDVLRIVALGGSTTDPYDEGHWPGFLSEVLEKEGIPARIFNGGVGSYSTNQEVIKLIRDALSLSPHVVISMDGVNDLGLVKSRSPATPMVNPQQEEILEYAVRGPQSVFLPNLARLLGFGRGILQEPHWGQPTETTAQDVWERNVRIMNVVSREFGARYLCVLQPIMGFGSYAPSAEDQRMWEELKDRPWRGGAYHQVLTSYYQAAQTRCRELPYCADLTDIFAGHQDLYENPRHPNPPGYRLIAEAVFQELRARDLVVRSRPEEGAHDETGAGETGG